ncbi:hypothetical protein PR202_gb26025 [Eleusine coracana subsp. coracana]|uniref:Uncharacterized protein n=1 Tax=Eleusine coracana subsp. coracana TaxID=191504 RepID=A0AAV5FQT0_ELECO|nr:hypothetical protein PR202_gb26025 [Eleusine coracana subsp. coracana]
MKDQADIRKNQKIHILHYQRNVDWGARILILCLKMRSRESQEGHNVHSQHIFRDYKSKLNCQYVKKNQTPFDKHGNISQQEWDEFVEQKTSSASKELSEKMVELNKRNKFKAWLDPGRYKKKIPIWREQEAKLRTEGKPDPLPNTNERTRNWVYGRSELTEEGEIIVKDHATSEVVQALKGPIAAQTEAGLFTPEYHKDELAKAIGTKEHGGRKHTLHKKEQEDKAKEDWRRQLLMFAIDKESGRLDPNLHAAVDAFIHDDITEDTPCELHVPFGYKGKTMKVALGTSFPGETLHNRDIPPGYVRVTVSEIVPGYEDNEIECPIPEAGIETLQDALGSFIIWKHREVVLSPRVSPPPLSGHGSFHTSQPANTGGQPSPMSAAASGNKPQSPHAEADSTHSPIIYSDKEPLLQIVQPRETIQVEPPSIAVAAVQVQAPLIQVQPAPIIINASVIPKTITGFDKEPKDPKARNDVDKYLAGLKKCLASTGKLVIEEQDPRDKVSYDDHILDNPVDDVDYPTFKLDKTPTEIGEMKAVMRNEARTQRAIREKAQWAAKMKRNAEIRKELHHVIRCVMRDQALQGGVREKVQLATKFGLRLDADGTWEIRGNPAYVRAACEGSLKRLGVDCIDLYYQHHINTHYVETGL